MVKIGNYTKDYFKGIIEGRSIICFGAGNELIQIIKDYPVIIKHISRIVDNNKAGTYFEYSDVRIPVISLSEIYKVYEDNLLLITTIRYADQFIKQLDDITIFNGQKLFVPYFFEERIEDVYDGISSKPIIPKKIHYCWFGNAEMPEQFKRNIDSWQRFCPDYEIIQWSESNYDISRNSYMQEAYNHGKWGFVPDYARLDIINEYGGIYLDTDVEVLRPFDELLGYELFCGYESKEYVAFGLGFGGCKNNEILKEMMEQYHQTAFVNDDGTLNQKASPVYQTEIMQRHGLRCDGTFQKIGNCVIFPTEFFAPINAFGLGEPTSRTFSIHQYAATWFDNNMKLSKERMIESIRYVKLRMEST